jgi:thymidylate kinase
LKGLTDLEKPRSASCSRPGSRAGTRPSSLRGGVVTAGQAVDSRAQEDPRAARGLELDWLLHAYAPFLWPDLVLYFAMPTLVSSRRVAATRRPRFYDPVRM